MYKFIRGTLFYSGTMPGFGSPATGARIQLDTSNLTEIATIPYIDPIYEYVPGSIDTIYGIVMFKITDYDTGAREVVQEFELGVDFEVGDILDLTSYVESLPPETPFIFAVVCTSDYTMYEISTTIETIESSGIIDTNYIIHDVPEVAYQQVEIITSINEFFSVIGNDWIGISFVNPDTDTLTFKLNSNIPTLITS